MKISTKDWVNYINKLAAINQKAADMMRQYVQKNGFANTNELIGYAHAVATRYGEAAAELTCQMYEATAEAQGAIIPAAEPEETPTYAEVAKAVNGTIDSPETMCNAVGRLTKRTGADTMLKNAIRDGAEFAWVPHGDTCAFCIALASRGWQKMSRKALKNGHAEHIHANCDCQYAVRFDGKSNVAGYDPDEYLEMYNGDNKGKSSKEKIKDLRNRITERQRVINHNVVYGETARDVDLEYIKSQKYRMTFRGITGNTEVEDRICEESRKILRNRTGSRKETLVLLDRETGNVLGIIDNSKKDDRIEYNDRIKAIIEKEKGKGKKIIAIHNHPDGYPPTADDCESAGERGYNIGVVVGHNGKVFIYKPSLKRWRESDCNNLHNAIALQADYVDSDEEMISIWLDIMREAGFTVEEKE